MPEAEQAGCVVSRRGSGDATRAARPGSLGRTAVGRTCLQRIEVVEGDALGVDDSRGRGRQPAVLRTLGRAARAADETDESTPGEPETATETL